MPGRVQLSGSESADPLSAPWAKARYQPPYSFGRDGEEIYVRPGTCAARPPPVDYATGGQLAILVDGNNRGIEHMDGSRQSVAVTFDFWGTLYENREADSIRLSLILARLQADGDVRAAYEYAHEVAHQYWRTERRPFSAAGRLEAMLRCLGVSMGEQAKAELVTELEEALLETPPEPAPHIRPLLQALRDRGVRIGLVSDTGITPGRVLRSIMAHDQLLSYFHFCAFSDEVGRAKPDPLPFERTLDKLGVPACLATHIGDLPETDIAGAKGLGMRAVLFTGLTLLAEADSRADAVLSSYADLQAALDTLLQG